MKYLGIDFGNKRIGLSVSDEEGRLAFPLSVLVNGEKLIDEILEIIKKENISAVVIGESKNYFGEPNKIMGEIKKFKKELEEEAKLSVIFEPEFMTSVQAEKITGKNEMVDASAAAIILQSFLDRKNSMV
jgi:putative holliday junction resolvase